MERLTFEGNFCDIAQCRELPCPYNGSCTQKEVWKRLKAYEDTGLYPESVEALKLSMMGKAISEITEFDGLPIDRLRELAEADKAGRVRIIPESQNETCGHCWYFEREPGTKHGTCAKRPHPRDRYGKIDRSKQFIVSQSTQSCRLYMSLRSEAERAMQEMEGKA